MKKRKINYSVSVYLADDKTSYRLKFYHKASKRYLTEFEERFTAGSYEEALRRRNAEQAKEKWMNYQPENGFVKGDFISFSREIVARQKIEGTRKMYEKALKDFIECIGSNTLSFHKLSEDGNKIMKHFRQFVLDRVDNNTAKNKQTVITSFLNAAYKDEDAIKELKNRIIIENIPLVKKQADILSQEEINLIINKGLYTNKYKRVFIFECLTTIGFSDLQRLTWGQIARETTIIEGETQVRHKIKFKRKKTGIDVTQILDDDIIEMLGNRGKHDDYVFPFLRSLRTYGRNIDKIIKEAGINKHITSHRGRATGIIRTIERVGIYEAMKQAGHSQVSTTEIYAQETDNMRDKVAKAAISGINLKPVLKAV